MRALSFIVTIALLSACSGSNEPEQTQNAAAAPGAVSTPTPPILSTKPVAQMTLEEAKAELRVVAEARLHANRTNDDARSEELRQRGRALFGRIRALESGG